MPTSTARGLLSQSAQNPAARDIRTPIHPKVAKALAGKGRAGDTMLAHINPQEAALLKSVGGSGTINPNTGLPEFGFFGDVFGGIGDALGSVGSAIGDGLGYVGNGLAGIADLTKNIPGVNALTSQLSVFGGLPAIKGELGALLPQYAAGAAGALGAGGLGGALGNLGGATVGGGSFLDNIGSFLGNGQGGSLTPVSQFLTGGATGANGIGGSLFGGGDSTLSSLLGGGGNALYGKLLSGALGAATGALGGGSSKGTAQQTNLLPWQQPYVLQGINAAQQQFLNGANSPAMSQASTNALNRIGSNANSASPTAIQNFLTQQAQTGPGIGPTTYGLPALTASMAKTPAAQAALGSTSGIDKALADAAATKAVGAGIGDTSGINSAINKLQSAPIYQQAGAQNLGGINSALNRLQNAPIYQQAGAVDMGQNKYIADTLGGKYLDPSSNPYLQATYDQAARSAISNNDALFASGGRFNSGAAQRALATGLGDLATNLYGQNYANERANMSNAAGLAQQQGAAQNAINQFNTGSLNSLTDSRNQAGLATQTNIGNTQNAINAYNTGSLNTQTDARNNAALGAQSNIFNNATQASIANAQQQNAYNLAQQGNALNAASNVFGAQNQNNQYNTSATNNWNQYTGSQNVNTLTNLANNANNIAQFNANYGLNAAQGALSAGNQLQSQQNQQLQAGQYQDAFNQQKYVAPWQNINSYLSAAGQPYGATATYQQPQNTLSNTLGGAANGLGIYGKIFG